MLRLARLVPSCPAEIRFGDYVPFAIDWPAHRSPDPRYWSISGDYEILMIGVNRVTGALVSVENPASLRVERAKSDLWPTESVREGHPVVDLGSFPADETYFDAQDATSFEFRHSPRSIRLSWGRAEMVVADGRCRFGFDSADDLVAIGIDGLTAPEARIVDDVMAFSAADRGRPAGS